MAKLPVTLRQAVFGRGESFLVILVAVFPKDLILGLVILGSSRVRSRRIVTRNSWPWTIPCGSWTVRRPAIFSGLVGMGIYVKPAGGTVHVMVFGSVFDTESWCVAYNVLESFITSAGSIEGQ